MNGQRTHEHGFTLLELLMVVIIIAILASIALPQYFRVTERSRTSQMLQLLASIRGSELRFKAQDPTNLYTVDLSATSKLDIVPLPTPPTGWAAATVTGTGSGSNVQSSRTAGVNSGANLIIDLDTGTVCASTAGSSADWNVTNSAACP
ncbi:MAG: prepilin-type N-terminal cleavage/methylation domain-containing protein [Candidatus Omnitrophica bacterium]|nr:prepilin-type N-terminal cleavage/methylation domain-containing protein [Candidatus Omnitrophota bacterium]